MNNYKHLAYIILYEKNKLFLKKYKIVVENIIFMAYTISEDKEGKPNKPEGEWIIC